MSQNTVFSIIVFSLLIVLIGYLRRGQKDQTRAREKGNRYILISRLRQRLGPPILCPTHSKDLQKGQMAVIDPTRCQICYPKIISPLPNNVA